MNRAMKDKILTYMTYASAAIAVIILLTILGYILIQGFKSISFDFIFSKYHPTNFYVNIDNVEETFERPENMPEDSYFSEEYGFALETGYDLKGHEVIQIGYIDKNSPLREAIIYSDEATPTKEKISLDSHYHIEGIYLIYEDPDNNWTTIPKNPKQAMDYIDEMDIELRMFVVNPGGGISGSIKTTLIMIGITLAIALPLGIGIAIYLTEYARKNKIINTLRMMIDMSTGVPSIVFGFVGVFVFQVLLKSGGPVIYGGGLVLVAILLPVVIRATEESLIAVPQSLRHASLALGANKTQTITKIVIPSALPGILTATILSIGRVVGESAALILVSGTIIEDNPNINTPGTTLAVHIWKEMSGENPNISFVAGISIVIIIVVLLLNLLLKYATKYLNRKYN